MLIISILIVIAIIVITTKEKEKQSSSNHTRPTEVPSIVPQRVLCCNNTPKQHTNYNTNNTFQITKTVTNDTSKETRW